MKPKQKRSKNTSEVLVKKIIILLVVAAMVVVVIFLIFRLINNPEKNTKHQIESMAKDYYENYYYDNFYNTIPSETTLAEAMKKYAEKGFAKMSLQQLLIFDKGKYKSLTDELSEYCDIDATSIKFFPESPYGKKDYRIEYNYSCNF